MQGNMMQILNQLINMLQKVVDHHTQHHIHLPSSPSPSPKFCMQHSILQEDLLPPPYLVFYSMLILQTILSGPTLISVKFSLEYFVPCPCSDYSAARIIKICAMSPAIEEDNHPPQSVPI